MFTGLPNLSLMSSALRRGGGASLKDQVIALFEGGTYDGALYKNSEPGTLWRDTGGSLAAGAGQSVARRDDLSGNGLHQTQASSSLRPIFDGAGALALDGSDDDMASAATLTLATPWTFIVVGEFVAGSASAYNPWFRLLVGSTDYAGVYFRQSIGSPAQYSRSAALGQEVIAGPTGTLPAATKGALIGKFAAGQNSIRRHGGTLYTAANSWTGGESVGSAELRLSNAGYARTSYGEMAIAKGLTDDEIALVVSYLND